MELTYENKRNLYIASLVLLIILSVYFVIRSVSEFRSYHLMGSSGTNVITLSGHGEVSASPDIASVYFTISKDAKTVSDAQAAVATVEKSALDFLKTSNVADADVQASNASFSPKYEYSQAICPQAFGTQVTYCPSGKQTITGYTASESITVKVRNIDNVGTIMQGLGGLGVTDLSGPNFSIDNPDAVQAEARKKAIDDAQTKAKALADDLGVHLGNIASFSESGNYPSPIFYDKAMNATSAGAPVAPAQLPQGQNTVTSDVTITYDIR